MLKTGDRVPMTEFPIPAYELAEIKHYFLGSIQYSSGCPYQCEFCDIPGLYGRNPRLKTPQQIIAELDKLLECGVVGSVYFVDDNFIGNRKAAKEMLPHLIEWQKRNSYPVMFACEQANHSQEYATANHLLAGELERRRGTFGFQRVDRSDRPDK